MRGVVRDATHAESERERWAQEMVCCGNVTFVHSCIVTFLHRYILASSHSYNPRDKAAGVAVIDELMTQFTQRVPRGASAPSHRPPSRSSAARWRNAANRGVNWLTQRRPHRRPIGL